MKPIVNNTIARAKALGRPSEGSRFLRINDVIATIGISRSQIYRLIQDEAFPAPSRLTKRCVGWWDDEIQAWLAERRTAA